MNDSLLTYDGGQPLYANDLSFMQNSLAAMTNNLAKAFGDTYIAWGCIDEAKENVVAGAVCIGGALYEVPALGALGENKLCFREVLSDERVFENEQSHKVKKTYEAYLSADTSGAVASVDLKTARNVSSWTQEEWDDTPYIELEEKELNNGWFEPEIKRIKTTGGWLYSVVLKCINTTVGPNSAGTIKGVQINNDITVFSFFDNIPAAVKISPGGTDNNPQKINVYIPSSNSILWSKGVSSLAGGMHILIQFSFFDPDEKVTREYSEVFG